MAVRNAATLFTKLPSSGRFASQEGVFIRPGSRHCLRPLAFLGRSRGLIGQYDLHPGEYKAKNDNRKTSTRSNRTSPFLRNEGMLSGNNNRSTLWLESNSTRTVHTI